MLTVAVFSYNRGAYLENCVASVRRNLPGVPVTVYDDNSDDPETRAVLAGLDVPVWHPAPGTGGRHGGLYANMQAALDAASDGLILFVQEDMQIVRPVAPDELEALEATLTADPRRAFLSPVFMKSQRLRRHRRLMVADAAARLYRLPDSPTPRQFARRIGYYDVTIAHVGRLRAAGWAFEGSEGANIHQAWRHFSDQPILGDPFVAYCPEVPIFRNRNQTLAARLAVRITGRDVNRLTDLTEAETARLRSRSINDWPVAEVWLRAEDPKIRRPFVYKDVKARWWLNLIHKIETKLRGGR